MLHETITDKNIPKGDWKALNEVNSGENPDGDKQYLFAFSN